MNKNFINKAVEFMVKMIVGFGIIFGIIVFLLIVFFIKELKDEAETDHKNTGIHMTYPDVVKNYLERKYRKNFIVDPKDYSYEGSPIPFYHGCYTATYYTYEKDDPDYTFIVDVTPVSVSDASIKELSDSYCWKFLREKLREDIKITLDDLLMNKYKVSIKNTAVITFGGSVTPNSKMEDYFKNQELQNPILIYINIYVYESENSVEQETEQRMRSLFNHYNFDNMSMKVRYFDIKNKDDFEAIDIIQIEDQFRGQHRTISDIEKEEKFTIKLIGDSLN